MNRYRGLLAVSLLAPVLAACGSASTVSTQPLAWVRTDGQSGRSNPALADQFANDRDACGLPAGATDNATLQAAAACMGRRGYVLVAASDAEATAARFRAANAAKYAKTP
ncbi:MAG TPA: hypothetical protein VFB16_12275 [Bauldia sp.]|nr:hypothetical protein [Bauldia sp.]